MPSFNRVTLIGNLTRDPETRDLPSGTTLCEFGLATTRHYKTQAGDDREETCFIDCTAFGKQAEVLQQYVTKGRPLFVEGRLKFDQWDDKNGGGKRSKISVVVENFQFLGTTGSSQAAGGDHGRESGPHGKQPELTSDPNSQTSPAARPPRGRRTKIDAAVGKEERFKDVDIPF